MEMQFDRYREVAGINRHSLTVEPLATGKEEVAALVAHLQGDDEGLKISSAQRLSVFRAPEAAPALASLLGDDSREVRVAAAMALGACGTRESVPPLLAALSTGDPLTAQAAAVALENLTGHREEFNGFAAPAERAAQAEKWRAWFAATNWQSIEQDLVQRLQDADRDVVRRAAVALGHIGQDAARDALRTYVARERENNPYPEWRKTNSGDGARFNSLSPANPRTLQAATRSLGYLQDVKALPMLAETVARHNDPATANLFLAEAAVEAMGRIGTPEAQDALVQALAGLKDYFFYVGWYGDHGALYACHASPVHYFIAEALDHQGSVRAASAVPHLIRSVPTDPDRALLLCTDDCEAVVGRVIRRQGAEAAVVETCLAILGDAEAARVAEIEQAIATTYAAWAGKPDPENRAAQILSLVCRDRSYEPRIRAALERYRVRPVVDLDREAARALPHKLPTRHWVCVLPRPDARQPGRSAVRGFLGGHARAMPARGLAGPSRSDLAQRDVPAKGLHAVLPGRGRLGPGPDRRSPGRPDLTGRDRRPDQRHRHPLCRRRVAGPPERPGQRRGRPNAGVHLSRGLRAQSPLAPGRQAGPLNRPWPGPEQRAADEADVVPGLGRDDRAAGEPVVSSKLRVAEFARIRGVAQGGVQPATARILGIRLLSLGTRNFEDSCCSSPLKKNSHPTPPLSASVPLISR